MFLSLNKKIILAIVAFFTICFSIFGYTLYSLYDNKLQEDRLFLHLKNQQYNELLYQYNKLRFETEKETSLLHIDELKDNKYEWVKKEIFRDKILHKNLYLILTSLILFSILIVVMILLLHLWVLNPITHFSQMNTIIRKGIYNQRLRLPHKLIQDEFNHLEQTYNQMLDNIEKQILHIQEQRQFLQNILNGIPDAIRVLDFSGNIILTNETYHRTLENSPLNTQTKCYQSLLQRKTPCPDKTNCPLHCLNKQKSIKFIQQLSSGKKPYLSVNAARIDTTEQPLIIEAFRDLSENIKFSHQQKISSLGFLTAAIAHEIKNNLGSMRLLLESILNTKISAKETKNYNELLYAQLLECIKIPERLLKIARAAPEEIQPVNSEESIREICSFLNYDATHNGIQIKIESDPSLPPVQGNETDFKMIILNLAQNAIKAMPNGGVLSFSLKNKKQYLEINVTDTGKGIPPRQLPHIFEPFFSHFTQNEHTGLGLTIVKSLVTGMDGDIKATSKLNVGTCFTLKIPYKNKK